MPCGQSNSDIGRPGRRCWQARLTTEERQTRCRVGWRTRVQADENLGEVRRTRWLGKQLGRRHRQTRLTREERGSLAFRNRQARTRKERQMRQWGEVRAYGHLALVRFFVKVHDPWFIL